MIRLVRLSWVRLSRRPAVWITVLLLALGLKGAVYLAARSGAFGNDVDNGFAYLTRSASYSLFLAAFLLFILAASSLAGEYASGLLRMYLPRPVSRTSWYLGRFFSLVLLVLIVLLLDAGLGMLFGGPGFGFRDTADTTLQGPSYAVASLARDAVKGYALAFLSFTALLSTGLLVSVLVRSPVGAIAVAVGLFFLMEGVRHIFLGPVASWMITGYATESLDTLGKLAQGESVYRDPSALTRALLIPGVWVAVTLPAGLWLFQRTDVLE